MQRLPAPLVPNATQTSGQLTASAATYYTTPANTTTEIQWAYATNATGTARTITIYIIRSGGAAGATNMVVNTRTVPAGGSVALPEMLQKMSSGGFIQALSDAATAVNLWVSGYEVTNN